MRTAADVQGCLLLGSAEQENIKMSLALKLLNVITVHFERCFRREPAGLSHYL